MNLQTVFRDFNPAKFIVWVCLAVFNFLFSLRLDGELDWSYWVIFTPIWIWKALVIIGALIGDIVWWHNPHYRLEGQSYTQFRALLISLGLHTFLLIFEILAAHNLETGDKPWISVFTPLILMSIISIGACVWAVKHDRSFELELFCAVNILQFIFIPLRLDEHILWSWEVVFVPAWILLCVSVFAVFYSIIYAALLLIMQEINPNRKRTSMNSAIMYTCLVSPLLIFLVSLANKLNGTSPASYVSVFLPLNMSFLTLIMMSFATKRANQWWFGLRKDLCQFVLGVCPLLQEYANISYSLPQPQEPNPRDLRNQEELRISDTKEVIGKPPRNDHKVIVPSISIEVPD